MIGLLEFKKALGSLEDDLSEEQIIKLRDQMDQEAEIFFSMWIDSIKEKKSYN